MAPVAGKPSCYAAYPTFEAELENHKAHFSKCTAKPKEYPAHSAKVHSVGWSCDGRRLASGSYDKTVTSFTLNEETGRLSREHTFKGHADSVDQLSWHPLNPDVLTTASGDKTVKVWDAKKNREITSIATKGDNINICWSPDGNNIAVGNKDDLVTFIDARTWKPFADEQFKFEVNELTWNNEGDLFFLTSGQGSIHILSYPDLKLQHVIQAHPANCICIKFDPTGKHFATGSADALVSLWDAKELVCVRTLSRLDWPIRTLSFSHDGKLVASASEDLVIDLAHVETGQKVAEVPTDSPTFTVAWHPKKYLLAFACEDKDKYNPDRDAGIIKLYGVIVD